MAVLLLSLVLAGELESHGSTTAAEKVDFSQTAVTEMWGIVQDLQRAEAEARAKGMAPEQACFAEGLRLTRALLAEAEVAANGLPDAIAKGDPATTEHEFRKVTVALGRARQEKTKAYECKSPPAPGTTPAGWGAAQAPVRVSMDFVDADIHDVLAFLAEASGQNIVVDDSVRGTVTVHLEDVAWTDALAAILATHGLMAVDLGQVQVVTSAGR